MARRFRKTRRRRPGTGVPGRMPDEALCGREARDDVAPATRALASAALPAIHRRAGARVHEVATAARGDDPE